MKTARWSLNHSKNNVQLIFIQHAAIDLTTGTRNVGVRKILKLVTKGPIGSVTPCFTTRMIDFQIDCDGSPESTVCLVTLNFLSVVLSLT